MGRLEKAMRRAAEDQTAVADLDLQLAPELTIDEFPSEAAPVAMAPPAVLQAPAQEPAPAQRPSLPTPVEQPARPAPAEPVSNAPVLRLLIDSSLATKTVVDDSMMPASREQYRRLAAALHQAQRTGSIKVVMVASAVAGEGKTLTASNLAMTLSESYRRDVLLIDADLRRPSLHKVFRVSGEPGLSDGLIAAEMPRLPLHRVAPKLAILPAGRPTSDPIGALTSERMRQLIDEAREIFDWIVIDTPPVGLLTDAALLTSMADLVVLVVKAESTPYDMVQRAVQAIGRERVIGTVLNRAKEQPHQSKYDYYKYYERQETDRLLNEGGVS